MPHSFWSNTIWYLLLLTSSTIGFVAALIKSKNRKFTIAFTLATLGLVYQFEQIVLIFFKAYTYLPKFVNDPNMDSILGNFISQISISCTSALLIEYGLSFKWYFFFAIVYFLIEELFLKLGIYQHHWWKSIYTSIGIVPLFWFIKIWYRKLTSSSKDFIHYITLFLSTFAITVHTISNPLRLMKIQLFKVKFTGEFSRDHKIATGIYFYFMIVILIYLYKRKLHWALKGIIFTILFLILYIFYRNGIIYYKDGWFPIAPLYNLLLTYLWIIVLDHFLSLALRKIDDHLSSCALLRYTA